MKQVTKTYGHNLGLSTAFRQWRAESHCRFIHGYALEIKLTFQCHDDEVDRQGWVIDFGSLKPFKEWLSDTFDHKFLVASDDPELALFVALHDKGIIDLVTVERVGCEAFAEMIHQAASNMLSNGDFGDTSAQLIGVEVREHGANSALYIPDEHTTILRITNGVASVQAGREILMTGELHDR